MYEFTKPDKCIIRLEAEEYIDKFIDAHVSSDLQANAVPYGFIYDRKTSARTTKLQNVNSNWQISTDGSIDLLGNLSNVRRTETFYNVIPPYGLFHAVYNVKHYANTLLLSMISIFISGFLGSRLYAMSPASRLVAKLLTERCLV